MPELIDASVTTNALKHARIGEHYIVAYTTSSYDKQYPEGITPSRKRTSVISSSGLDPAMFVDSPELRRILDLAATERGRESTKLRRLLLKTFSEDTPVLQRLAAGQFALDTEMSAKLSSREKSLLQAAAFNDQINPTTRSLLITAAVNRPNDFGTWATGAINKVLENTPVDGYPTGTADHTGLVLLAFTEAMDRGIEVPYQTLARWLRSSHQLYLERASSLLQMRYPERSRSAFEEALGKTDPESKAYRFLEGKLRDVKRQDVGTDAQKH
ncbi:MAG TPA: hypothetical protein VFN25_09175 [Dokdonella sp.]|uniref:hypothetical protein n=1 Tax=Dokdonella sp. TaxID=2291710 RepID=UPI002D7FA733|nr:hypothetical protein [Dokdonella sp.]HET9033064.1 hypothetical protein [Dokdonella sp.]